MRPIWSGSISFGLVNIPVNVYSATQEHGIKFDLLHKKDLSRVRYAKFCKEEEKEISQDEIVKGYEYEKGLYVVIDDEDFKKVNPHKSKTIDIQLFIKESEIDSIYYEKPYILEPSKGAAKAYTLLREALNSAKKVAVASFVMHNKEHIAAIKPYGRALLLCQLRYANEIRDFNQLELPVMKIAPSELDMALKLIGQLTNKFTPEKFHDGSLDDLNEIIEAKIKNHKIFPKSNEPKATIPQDLMKELKESLKLHPKVSTRKAKSDVSKGRRKILQ